MTKKLKEIATIENVAKEIDTILSDTPALTGGSKNFMDSLKIAIAIGDLRKAFDNPQIKDLIGKMQDTDLGFLTDRPPGSDAEKKRGTYDYETVKECCINAMINGYRLSNNEFNIIAGRMYAAKNGKFRKIVENPSITDFQFTTAPPVYDQETRVQYGRPETVQFAKVKCFASWKKDGVLCALGIQDKDSGKEDTTIFKIKVNNMMGDDAIIGKAHSKLFSRVLSRIEGIVAPDADIDDSQQIIRPKSTGKTLKERMNAETVVDAEEPADPKQEPKKEPESPAEPSKDVKQAIYLSKNFPEIFDEARSIIGIDRTIPVEFYDDRNAIKICRKVSELVDAQN